MMARTAGRLCGGGRLGTWAGLAGGPAEMDSQEVFQ